jgi:hypothetical protein
MSTSGYSSTWVACSPVRSTPLRPTTFASTLGGLGSVAGVGVLFLEQVTLDLALAQEFEVLFYAGEEKTLAIADKSRITNAVIRGGLPRSAKARPGQLNEQQVQYSREKRPKSNPLPLTI